MRRSHNGRACRNDGVDLLGADLGGAAAKASVSREEVSRNGDGGGLRHPHIIAVGIEKSAGLSKKEGRSPGSALGHWNDIGDGQAVFFAFLHQVAYASD